MERSGLAFWEAVSTKFRYSPPLTPGDSDIAWYRQHALRCLRAGDAPSRGLLLGVTPGIAAMPRPEGTMLVPVDWSDGMIRNVLPRAADAQRAFPVRGDWRELPLAGASCAIAFCDLLFPALPSFEDGRLALRELARVLQPGGLLCIRCFLRADPAETPEELLRELAECRTPDLGVFRMRLAAALQGAFQGGVFMNEVWKVFDQRFADRSALARLYGADPRAFDGIERWKSLRFRYSFLSLAELTEITRAHFEIEETLFPDYVAGRRIARLALRTR